MGDQNKSTHENISWDDWKAEAEKALRGKTLESLHKSTYEGIEIKPLYDASDIESLNDMISTVKKANRNEWRVSQAIIGQNTIEMKEKIRLAKERGQKSFFLNDLHFLKSKEDLHSAFQHINWKEDSIFFDVRNNLGLMSLFLQDIEEKNELKDVDGTIGFDPYEQLLLKGESIVPISNKLDFLADTIKWMSENHAKSRCILIKGSLYTDAGANAYQELVYTFSHALDTINELLDRNLPLEQIVSRITFSFGIGSNFFMEIAKLRAAKHIWASLIQALGGDHSTQSIYLHARTTTYNKTIFDVHVNLLRTTTESFAAAVAGVDELTIIPFDHVLNGQSELGERIARNTHFILKDESLLSRVIDPANGSYYIETLTNELANKAWNEIKRLDAEGGLLQKLIQGTIQEELEEVAAKRQHDIYHQITLVTGTNAFANPKDLVQLSPWNNQETPQNLEAQTNDVNSFREALIYAKEKNAAPHLKSNQSTPSILIKPLKIKRLVEDFEHLRLEAMKSKRKGNPLKVGVITFGHLKDYKQRLDLVSGILSSGGVDVEVCPFDELSHIDTLRIFILCGKDLDYQLINPAFINRLKHDDKPIHLFVTGNGHEEMVKEFQLDGMITSNMNIYEFLVNIHHILGVTIE